RQSHGNDHSLLHLPSCRAANGTLGGRVMTRSTRLANKVALVTGAGSGIGRGVALMFARHGARVMGTDIDSRSMQETVDLARGEGLQMACMHSIDLTLEAQVRQLVEQTVASLGWLDVLVNAGAWGAFEPLETMDFDKHWRRTLQCELDVVF